MTITYKGCGHSDRGNSAPANFNKAFWLAAISNGFGISQIQSFCHDLNFNGVSENENKQAIHLMSLYNTTLRNEARTEIIALGREDQERWVKQMIESKDKVIYLCCDGAYPTRYYILQVYV